MTNWSPEDEARLQRAARACPPEYDSWPPPTELDWPIIAQRWIEQAAFEHHVGRSWHRRYRSMCRLTVLLMCAVAVVMILAAWGWMR